MNILLIQPPIRDYYRTEFREYPLGLLYLGAALEKAGHTVTLLDARKCKKGKVVAPYPELGDIDNLYNKSGKPFGSFRHFGIDYSAISQHVLDCKPDAVCITSNFTPYINEVIETARAVKAADPDCRIFVGGHAATTEPEIHVNSGVIDCVVAGEGEEVLLEVVQNCFFDVCHREESRDAGRRGDLTNSYVYGRLPRRFAPRNDINLDSLSTPSRHLLNPADYMFGRRRYSMILTSRGCPHDCSFCSVHSVSGHGYRKRSVDSVIDEIDEAVNKFDISVFDFQDDNLLFDHERSLSLFENICRRFEGKGIEFMATNGLNAAHLNFEILFLLKRCGFSKLDIALGTGLVKTRDKFSRPEEVSKYEEVLKTAVSLGLRVTTYIILGIPFQPIAEMRETIEYLKNLNTLISPSIFYNVSGMKIYEEMKQYEYSDSHVCRRGSAINCKGNDFGREEILEMVMGIREYNLSSRNSG